MTSVLANGVATCYLLQEKLGDMEQVLNDALAQVVCRLFLSCAAYIKWLCVYVRT